jgi:hypothetical protein
MWRFEQERIPSLTYSSDKRTHTEVAVWNCCCLLSPLRFGVKAEVLEEEMRRSTLENANYG